MGEGPGSDTYWIRTSYSMAAVVVNREGVVVEAAPIYGWMEGKPWSEVQRWWRIEEWGLL